jgi:magnesium transporter
VQENWWDSERLTEYTVPAGAVVTRALDKGQKVRLPAGAPDVQPARDTAGGTYQFPAMCEVRTAPVAWFDLAQVVGLSVMGICLWGTLIGAMLPLAFKRLGIDPGLASSPFVATAVDVTGILIFFSIASVYLL